MWKCVISAYLAQRTQLMCWLREKRNFCLWTVQTLMVLSSEAVTRVCPSPEKLTLRTEAVWALNDVDSAFLQVYINTETHKMIKHSETHMRFIFYAERNKEHVWSIPLMIKMLKIKCVTHRLGTQRRTVLSLDEEATRWPVGENCTDRTASLCPFKRNARIWAFLFHIITQESKELVAARGTSTDKPSQVSRRPEKYTAEKIIKRNWLQLPICFML